MQRAEAWEFFSIWLPRLDGMVGNFLLLAVWAGTIPPSLTSVLTVISWIRTSLAFVQPSSRLRLLTRPALAENTR